MDNISKRDQLKQTTLYQYLKIHHFLKDGKPTKVKSGK